MSAYRSALEAALEAMRKASTWIYYRRLAGGDPMSEEEELLFRAVAKCEEALRRTDQEPVAWRLRIGESDVKREGQKLFGLRCRELAEENAHLRDALVKAEENLRRPLPSRPDFRASWNPPSNYSDAYDWHQYLDKPEEKASQPVNGPGTAVDSRSAACSSSSVPRSQPSGIVSSGAPTPSQATLSNDALQGPVATLHDDGCFTWKRDEFRLKYDRQRAGWRMDVYAYPPELKAPMAWDDRPLLAHCLEAVNAACSAWSDVRNLNGDIDGGKCAAAAALERIAKDRIKELAAQCASPPEPEKPAARRLTDEEFDDLVIDEKGLPRSHLEYGRVIESALAALWGVKLP